MMKTANETRTFEARQWRDAFVSQPCYPDQQPVEYPASWAIYDAETNVRIAYANSEQQARKSAEKWTNGNIPTDLQAKAESAAYLLTLLDPGDTVTTVLRHVSTSGMSRRISCAVAVGSNIEDITWHVARVLGEPIKNRAGYVQDVGIVQGGCGMDMGFNLVYNLGRVLFPDGFAVQGRGRNGDTSGHDEDGGYALKQRWL